MIPECGAILCPYETFKEIVLDRINIKCVNEPLQSSLAAMSSGDSSSSENDLSNVGIVFITISVCVVVFLLIQFLIYWFGPSSKGYDAIDEKREKLLG